MAQKRTPDPPTPDLSTPQACVEYGRRATDREFSRVRARLLKNIATEPAVAYAAVIQWPLDRLQRCAPALGPAAAERFAIVLHTEMRQLSGRRFEIVKPYFLSAMAKDDSLWNWLPFSALRGAAPDLEHVVLEDPEFGFHLGNGMEAPRFRLFADAIAQGIAQSAQWSAQAGEKWMIGRARPCANRFAAAVATSSCYSEQACLKWRAELSQPYLDRLVTKAAENPFMAYEAVVRPRKTGWTKRHLRPYHQVLAASVEAQAKLLEGYSSLDLHTRRFLYHIYHDFESAGRSHVAKQEYHLLLQARKFALQAGQHASFETELGKAVEAGTTREWASTIIEAFTSGSAIEERRIA